MMTNNDSATTVSPDLQTLEEETTVYLIPLTFLSFAFISSGNILTIAAIATSPPLQTSSNAFVASLAVADLVVGVAVFSFGLWLVPSVRNLFESAIYICVTQLSNAFMSIFVSIYSMLLVACDRWLIISRPYLHQRLVTRKVIAGAIGLPWLFGFLFGFSQFLILDPVQDPPVCAITSLYPRLYYRIIAPTCYFIAVAGIFGFYLNIVLIARRHGQAIRRQNKVQALNSSVNGADGRSVPQTNPKGPKFNSQHWKATKMMMSVFGVFFVCWTPRLCLNMIDDEGSNVFSEISINIGLLNSGVNFLVYPFHSQEFRAAFKRILCFRRQT